MPVSGVESSLIDLYMFLTSCRRWLPAFYPLFRTGGHTMNEELKPHPVLTKLFRATHPPTLDFEVTHCPMVSPPVPWHATNKGNHFEVTLFPMVSPLVPWHATNEGYDFEVTLCPMVSPPVPWHATNKGNNFEMTHCPMLSQPVPWNVTNKGNNFKVTHCPMVSPAIPWLVACLFLHRFKTSLFFLIHLGGYVVSQVPFIRLPIQAQQQLVKLKSMDQQQLYPAFDSLNQLGSTPWLVNERVSVLIF